jgi:chromosomal replication initiation ATPase DnaA
MNAVPDAGIDLRRHLKVVPPAPEPVEEEPRPIKVLPRKARISDVVQLVADYYDVRPEDLLTRRTPRCRRLQGICAMLANDVLGASYPAIARSMKRSVGVRLAHVVKNLRKTVRSDVDLALEIAELEMRISVMTGRLRQYRSMPNTEQVSLLMRRMSIKRVLKIVADYYDIPTTILTGDSRLVAYVRPRQIACVLAKEILRRSLPEIGRVINRDHTTVLHALRSIAAKLPADIELAYEIEELRDLILSDGPGVIG